MNDTNHNLIYPILNDETLVNITKRKVDEKDRMQFFLAHFPITQWYLVENYVYQYMQLLVPDYDGGYWNYYTLSNGGCYIALEEPKGMTFRVCVAGNSFDDEMSVDAACIVACLFAWNHLTRLYHGIPIRNHYYRLLDFAHEHEESGLIFRAID